MILLSVINNYYNINISNIIAFNCLYIFFVYLGYLEFCKLPLNFNAISYALKIYQKFKSNNVLELKLIDLCKSLSKNLDLTKRKQHIEENLEFMEDIVEKSLIISYFLKDVEVSSVTSCVLLIFFFLLNLYIKRLFYSNYV